MPAADVGALVDGVALVALRAARDTLDASAVSALVVRADDGAALRREPEQLDGAAAAHVVAQLAQAAAKQSNERVRNAQLPALAAWCACAPALDADAVALVDKQLALSGPASKRTGDEALLRVLVAALRGARGGERGALSDALVKKLQDATAGPNMVADAAAAAASSVVRDATLALTALALYDGGARVPKGAWLLMQARGGTFAPPTRDTSDAVEALACAAALPAKVTSDAALARPLVRAAVLADGAVRRVVMQQVERVVAARPSLAAALVSALQQLLGRVATSDASADASVALERPHRNAVRALCGRIVHASAHTDAPLDAARATRVLMCVCHTAALPIGSLSNVRARGVAQLVAGLAHWWHSQRRALSLLDAEPRVLVAALRVPEDEAERKPSAEESAAADKGGKAKKKGGKRKPQADAGADEAALAAARAAEKLRMASWRDAACGALATLACGAVVGERALLDGTIEPLSRLLSAKELCALTPHELRVYFASPDDEPVAEADDGTYKAEVKNAGAAALARAAEERRKLLESQARTRARIGRVLEQSVSAMTALEALFGANAALLSDEAAHVVRALLPLVGCLLTARRAARLLALVLRTTPLPRRVGDACLDALLRVSAVRQELRHTSASAEAVQSAVQQLRAASDDQPLNGATLAACMPLLHEALNGGHLFTVLDGALHVLEVHAVEAAAMGVDGEYPCDEMFVTLRELLASDGTPPRIVARARAAVEQFATALAPSQLIALVRALSEDSAAVRIASLGALRIAAQQLGTLGMLNAIGATVRREAEGDALDGDQSAALGDDDEDDDDEDDGDDGDDTDHNDDGAAGDAADDAEALGGDPHHGAGLFTSAVYVLRHDATSEVSELAKALWSELDVEPRSGRSALVWLGALLVSHSEERRQAVCTAFADAMVLDRDAASSVLRALFARFELHPAPPESDHYMDMAARAARDELARARRAVRQGQMCAVGAMIAALPSDAATLALLDEFFDFAGRKAFVDVDNAVRTEALQAGLKALDVHAVNHTAALLNTLRERLDAAAAGGAQLDGARTAFVVLIGGAARHLPPDDERVRDALRSMLETLRTPSLSVQRAVGGALAPLVRPLRPDTPWQPPADDADKGDEPETAADESDVVGVLVRGVLEMTRSSNYGERCGGAFGVAALVRGLGTRALTDRGIMASLMRQLGDRRSVHVREGALQAYERLSLELEILFEPYIPAVLPRLLQRFGDSSADVRKAAAVTARAFMSTLTGFGVRRVVPSVLRAMKGNKDWRQKCGAVELLGAMAFVSPRQLSVCLPLVVPRLIALLADSRGEVHDAARGALGHVGAVIRNPELLPNVSLLLRALRAPDEFASAALDALAATRFVHRIDAPSLSLVMPLLLRGLRERSSHVKRRAAQIAGNMTTLADAADLEPYVRELLPAVRTQLFDPVPDSRAAAARALGLLSAPLVDTPPYRELVPWLRARMRKTAESGVERAGAAQGLAHVAAAVYDEDGGALMRSLIKVCVRDAADNEPHVREGALSLLVFAPPLLGARLVSSLPRLLPAVLGAYADSNDSVRDTAQRAAESLVTQFAPSPSTLDVLLPSLEDGLFSGEWRVRAAATELIATLLRQLADFVGDDDAEIDDAHKLALEGADDDDDDDDNGGDASAAAGKAGDSEKKLQAAAAKTAAEAVKSDPKTSALQALHAAQRKLKNYSPDDQSKAAKKIKRDVRKLATKCGVKPQDAIEAAYNGEAAIVATGIDDPEAAAAAAAAVGGDGDDDDDDDFDVVDDAEAAARREEAAQINARLTFTERALRTELRLKRALDDERRRRVLASLYVMQSDTVHAVVEVAMREWKTLVTNTPKTLTEVQSGMLTVVVHNLSLGSAERREIAARALATLVRKLGDRVLPNLLQLLRTQSREGDAATRQGIVYALGDVINAMPRAQLDKAQKSVGAIVRNALHDDEAAVRAAAGGAFNALFGALGNAAVSAVVPPLLDALDKPPPRGQRALDGIRNALRARPAAVLPLVLPTLAKLPMTTFRAHAIASLAEAMDDAEALNQNMRAMLPPLLHAAAAGSATANDADADDAVAERREVAAAALEAAAVVCGAVEDEYAARHACELLLDALRSPDSDKRDNSALRVAAAQTAGALCSRAADALSDDERERLLDELLRALGDSHKTVQSAAWGALSELTKAVGKERAPHLLDTLRSTLADVQLDLRRRLMAARGEATSALTFIDADDSKLPEVELPGLSLPKGLKPLLPIVVQALSHGSPEQRASAADGMAQLAALTNPAALKPHVIQMVGPLIRVVADRFAPPVRCAILRALRLLLGKSAASLKPFVTQLQTTFVKALGDQSADVRHAAALALAQLLAALGTARLDVLLGQLTQLVEEAERRDTSALTAIEAALSCSAARAGKASADAVENAREALLERARAAPQAAGDEFEDDAVLPALAAALAAALARSDEQQRATARSSLASSTDAEKHFVALLDSALAKQTAE